MGRKFEPFKVGQQFIIIPENSTAPTSGSIPLVMAPGAFGSGEHETTASCLEILETLNLSLVKDLLDLGSGTGILAIAAVKVGAQKAHCIDIQQEAVDSCLLNCRLNQVENAVRHTCGTLADDHDNSYDLVIANIYGDILLDVAEDLVRSAKQGSHILLSGILWEYNFLVRQKYEKLGCTLIRNKMLEEFSTVLLKKS